MSRFTIQNAANTPLNIQQGTIPNMSEALTDYFQQMTFTKIVKSVVGFEVLETPTNINFWGVIMPYTGRQLSLLPEGQRAWEWVTLYAQSVLKLFPDDVIYYQGKQIRVMSQKDYSLYSFVEYSLVLDWRGGGPNL